MKNIILLLIVFSFFSQYAYGHGQNTHKYMTYEAYYLLKNYVGSIPEMETHLGSTSSYYDGDYAFQRRYITTGAYREDEEDLVYGYDGYLLSGLGLDFDDWIVSITHFWDADDGDNAVNSFYATTPPWHTHTNLGVFPNSYTKLKKFSNPNKSWEIKFKMTPGSAEFRLASGTLIYIPHCGGVGIKYNSLVELYKTGKAWITGYYHCPNADWVSCNYEVILGQGYRDALVWEILGRMCHLLEDLSVPAHANKDEHGYYSDPYEDYMSSSLNYSLSSNELSLIPFINPYDFQNSDPLHALMYVVSQVSDHYASRGEDQNGDSDNDLGGNGTTAEKDFINTHYPLSNLGYPITHSQAANGGYNVNIKNHTYPLAIGATAGLLYWFAIETGLIEPITFVASASISPSVNNAGSGRAGTYFTGDFYIINNGNVPLNITIQSNYQDIEFIGESSTHYLQIALMPGQIKTINYISSFGRYDYGPFTSIVQIFDNPNNIHKTHSVIGTRLLPDFCFGETQARSASPEEQLFDGAFLGYFGFESDSLSFDKSRSIKERLDFAYKILKKDKIEKVENICKAIIELYPESEMGISFYAMGLLWEAAYSDEAQNFKENDFKKYLTELTQRKEKYKIYGYAQLILSLFDEENEIEGLEKLFEDYEYSGLKELSLFHQIIHYYIYKQDIEKARKISKKLDDLFVDSRYGYQAHLLFKDEGYTLKGLITLVERQRASLIAKRLGNNYDLLSEMPNEYKLYNNYPNPFNPSTTIKFSVPKNSNVKLNIFNMMGELIKTLVDEIKAPGTYNEEWDGTNLNNSKVASGIYFYRLESNEFVANNKMVLLK